jgi:NAD(P)-dependent dehydrogenase (short-subunit alcohol dehydrogenase family)
MMSGELKDKVAIVTGAGSVGAGIGNGKATAIVFSRESAKLMLVDCNLRAVEETRDLIEQDGGTAFTYVADVSQSQDCRSIIDTCLQTYGRIDILHNNVGIEIAGGLEETTEEAWDRTLLVNLKSMFMLCKYAIPSMVKQGSGVIINISSINAIRTLPALSLPYGVSKAGVIALSREIAVEYAAKGIRVNTILPGMMNTPFVRDALTQAYGGNIEEMTKYRDSLCPMGHQGESWDVANLALFLASERSKYITGAAFILDGAQTCRI